MTIQPLPALTTEQMIEVDRLMIEVYGINLIQMMENAGRNLAMLAKSRTGDSVSGKKITVLCGAGNNGGGGLVAARHLSNWGADVTIILAAPIETLKPVPGHQWRALAELPVKKSGMMNDPDLILDALIGYGLQGNPRGTVAKLIEQANRSPAPIIALDAPSGLDTTDGIPGKPCIVAGATLTLALPKVGLLTKQARPVVGQLFVGDISVPPSLYTRLGLNVPPVFDKDPVIPFNVS